MNQLLFIIAILFIFIITTVSFHELTHVALNGFRVDGVCFLDCRQMDNGGLLGTGYTPFGVYLTNPKYDLAENELIAHSVGLVFGGLIIAGFWSRFND